MNSEKKPIVISHSKSENTYMDSLKKSDFYRNKARHIRVLQAISLNCKDGGMDCKSGKSITTFPIGGK